MFYFVVVQYRAIQPSEGCVGLTETLRLRAPVCAVSSTLPHALQHSAALGA